MAILIKKKVQKKQDFIYPFFKEGNRKSSCYLKIVSYGTFTTGYQFNTKPNYMYRKLRFRSYQAHDLASVLKQL